VYELIFKLKPHFHSLREIENNVSLDLKLPNTWQFEKIVNKYNNIKCKIQDKNDRLSLLSIVSVSSEDGYNSVFEAALDIIVHNKEEEEKQRLFKEKVKELEELFKQQSLDKLKNFFQMRALDNTQDKITENGYKQVDTDSLELVGEGEEERSGTNFIGEKEDDR
jgi:hypothetical protein